jgi:DnaJ-class molecular chaperone
MEQQKKRANEMKIGNMPEITKIFMQTESGKSEPRLVCKRCFGRGFYLKAGGFTQADRVPCHKCDGSGVVERYLNKKKKPRVDGYRYSKEGVSE